MLSIFFSSSHLKWHIIVLFKCLIRFNMHTHIRQLILSDVCVLLLWFSMLCHIKCIKSYLNFILYFPEKIKEQKKNSKFWEKAIFDFVHTKRKIRWFFFLFLFKTHNFSICFFLFSFVVAGRWVLKRTLRDRNTKMKWHKSVINYNYFGKL